MSRGIIEHKMKEEYKKSIVGIGEGRDTIYIPYGVLISHL
jgi:hypothetical protein